MYHLAKQVCAKAIIDGGLGVQGIVAINISLMGKITIAVVEGGGYMMSDFQSRIISFLRINKHLAYERELLVCMI